MTVACTFYIPSKTTIIAIESGSTPELMIFFTLSYIPFIVSLSIVFVSVYMQTQMANYNLFSLCRRIFFYEPAD